jgi:YHS domain-containing protein
MSYVKILNSTLAISLILFGCVHGTSGLAKPKPQLTCPVMGGEINKERYTYYDGKRINFCCKGCIGEFYQDPAKYVKTLEDEGVTLEKVSMGRKSTQGTDEGNNKRSARSSCGCGCSSK